jgi:hypothetical protein
MFFVFRPGSQPLFGLSVAVAFTIAALVLPVIWFGPVAPLVDPVGAS